MIEDEEDAALPSDDDDSPPDAHEDPADAGQMPNPRPDAARPPPKDAGADPDEEGPRRDAGSDASADDGSTPEVDAGMPVPDASTEPPPPPVDAGVRDAGGETPVVDAGRADAGQPDNDLRCIPGTYAGAFSGEISALLGLVRIDITGTISIDIAAPEANGQQLPIRSGKLMGEDQDGNDIEAVITGTLNCATRRLENGRISNGTYTRRDPIWGGPETTVKFTGTATATYNFDPPSATGQWEVMRETGLRGGSGVWSATLQR